MEKVKAHQTLPTQWQKREELRTKGQFWTPSWVANAMITYVSKETDLVFDPASGEGAFYEALKQIAPSIKFYGTDIDSTVLTSKIYNNNGCVLEVRDFIKNAPNRKFKAIVANPPYIRHHRIDESTKRFLKQLSFLKTGFILDGRAGLHNYFLIQALELLENDGKLAFIMPADTCEGKSAKQLWQWITSKYCVDCVATFDSKATPFPNVDTNALVFFIRKNIQTEKIVWCKIKKPHTQDFSNFVKSNFQVGYCTDIEVQLREVEEALETGFSRPQQTGEKAIYVLSDFAQILRGIATGSNEYFFLTKKQINELKLDSQYFRRAIGRTKDINKEVITPYDLEELEKKERPTYLLSLNVEQELNDPILLDYLQKGQQLDLPNRPLIQQRRPWYKMEKREIPPLLFAYLGRRDIRFILNEANVLPLTAFLCVYPNSKDKESIADLWRALNHPDTLKNLQSIGKSYGTEAIKVEPNNLRNLPIPTHIVEKFNLCTNSKKSDNQSSLF